MLASVILPLTIPFLVTPAAADWSPDAFDYNRPDRPQVREISDPGRVKIAQAVHQHLVFRDLSGQDVPVLITLPKARAPFPAVVLVHGYASTREQITHQVAPDLVARGFATLAIDLPMHGDRPGPPQTMFVEKDAKKSYRHVVQAVTDIRQAIDLAESRKDLDTSRGVSMVGYSMGGWLAALAGAADRRVSALVLMVPISEPAPLDRKAHPAGEHGQKLLLDRFPVLRPTGAIAHFVPRPVLIQAGKLDPFLPKEPVDDLFAAAQEPKELRWYNAGHILPKKASVEAANWLLQRAGRTERVGGGEGESGGGGDGKAAKKGP